MMSYALALWSTRLQDKAVAMVSLFCLRKDYSLVKITSDPSR